MRSSSWLWITILVAAIANIGYSGPLVIVLPKLIREVYMTGPWLLGFLGTVGALGAIVGTFVVGQVQPRRRRGLLAYSSILLSGFALLLFGFPLPPASRIIAACIGSCVAGFGLAIFQVIWVTVLQELVPVSKLGRVNSIDMLGSYCLLPVGFLLTGILADYMGPAWIFIGGGLLLLIMAVVGLSIRDIRHL